MTLEGRDAHTGSTPMPMRRNAGRGLAQVTEAVHAIAMSHQPYAVGAIGHIDVYPNSHIVSGAGHDACWISRVAPTAMVFCPCKDGLSHNEAEEITPDWAEKGANVLFHAVVETAEIVE